MTDYLIPERNWKADDGTHAWWVQDRPPEYGTDDDTFTVEVELDPNTCGMARSEVAEVGGRWPTRTYRVQVVPGMVLPIVEALHSGPPRSSAIEMVPSGVFVLREWTNHFTWDSWQYLPAHLPPAAKPGMWAVRLAVHP